MPLVSQDLEQFFVEWRSPNAAQTEAFREALEMARQESDLQSFLDQHPSLLIQHLGGGYGRWVISQKRLGSEFVTDFMIGEVSSLGVEWLAVELESPRADLFTKAGDPSRHLTHAIRQIQDWRSWLRRNQGYAARQRIDHGLGLADVSPALPGLILIGRREKVARTTASLRQQMAEDLNIKIHTYDYLMESAAGRSNA